MPQVRQSYGTSQAALRRAVRSITGFAAAMLAALVPAFAQVPELGDKFIGPPFITAPASFSAKAVVPNAVSPPPEAATPGGLARPELRGSADSARPAGSLWLNRVSRKSQAAGPETWWLGMGGMALVLAICGAIGVMARRLSPRVANGAIQVVGRVSLSPKHAVYLLKVGQRVLLVGAGPQGAPALLGELDGLPEAAPSSEERGEP